MNTAGGPVRPEKSLVMGNRVAVILSREETEIMLFCCEHVITPKIDVSFRSRDLKGRPAS